MSAERLCLIVDLVDDQDLIIQYENWHRPGGPPSAVTQSIRNAGIEEMQIFRSGNRLIMVIDVNEQFDPVAKATADATDPEIQAWEKLMDRFQRPVAWATEGQKWSPAPSIYKLSDQPDEIRRSQP